MARRARKVVEMSIAKGWAGACCFARRTIDESGQRSEAESKQALYSVSKAKRIQVGYLCIANERLSGDGNCFLPQITAYED